MRLRTRTTAIAATTVVLVGAGGVAIATGVVGGDDDLTRPGTVTVDESALPDDDDAAEQEALAGLATVDQADAERVAVDSVGGGEVVRSELEEEDGFVVWEVTVRATDGAHHEVAVDAGDASVLGTERDDEDDDGADDGADDELIPGTVTVDESTLPEDDDSAEQEALAGLATVDQVDAERAAVESVGGGDALRSELEEEDGFVVWEVTVRADDGTRHEVAIDAGDASVLGTELDDDEDGTDDD